MGITNPTRPCTAVPGRAVDGWDPNGYGNIGASGYVFFEFPDGTIGRRFPDGREQRVVIRDCPGGVSGPVWVDVGITVDDVIDDAVSNARRRIPAPTLDISPSPAAGGIVNLGMWLAVAEPAPVTVRAEAGALWAEATATLASTTWDMGNGDTVTCVGAGTPIPDPSDPGAGPCGYTYLRSSPDDAPFSLAVTASWSITYRSSAGGGTRAGLDRSVTATYDVDEIQTIGVAN